MKLFSIFSLLLITVTVTGQTSASINLYSNIDSIYKSKEKEAIGQRLPSFAAKYRNQVFTSESLKGKVVFINMWFAACAPCMAEMAQLNTLYDTLKNQEKFEFISITFESERVINRLVQKFHINYKIISLPTEECNKINLNTSFPTSLIIGEDGVINFMKIGGSIDQKEINQTILRSYYPKILKLL